jgi:hypothetical protein
MANGVKSKDALFQDGPIDRAMQAWAVRVWDKDDSRSVLRLAPDTIRRRMAEMPDDVREMTEPELRKIISPTPQDRQIRLAFWNEYNRVQERYLPKMETIPIIQGIVSEDFFYNKYLSNPHRVAWVLQPPSSYTVRLQDMLHFGMEQLLETLAVPHIVGGKVNTKLLELKLKITAMADMRLNGAVTQKLQIEQKSMNYNVHARNTAAELQGAVEHMNMDQLEKRIEVLRKKEAMITQGVHPGIPQQPLDIDEAEVINVPQEARDDRPEST